MATENKSPEVRFAGFTEDWVQNFLETEVDFFSGLTYSPLDVQKKKGTFVIRSSNVKNSELVKADDVYVNSEVVNSSNVEKGDIAVVVRNGSRSLIGKHAQIKIDLKDTVIGAFMTGLRPKNNSDFINALLDTETFQKEIQKNLGATINQITTGPFKKMEFFFPNPEEQEVVGEFFKNLNKSISVSKEKLTKLKNLKKAMLTKMFPQDGASVPEIRFKGFDGEWVECRLGELFEFQYGVFNNNPNNGGKYPIYGANGIIGGYSDYNAEDSVVIGHMGEYAGIVLWVNGKHFVTYNGIITKPKTEAVSSRFGYFLLKNEDIRKICGGSGQPFLSYEMLNRININYPSSNNEQNKLTSFLGSFDDLITNHNEQLKKLNNIKKACLSKLFVA